MDKRKLKIKFPKERLDESLPLYPWSFLPYAPPSDCVFDSYRGTVGFDIFPFAITTRVNSADEVWLKIYVEQQETGDDA